MAAISGNDIEHGWKFLEEVTSNAAQVQDQLLEQILSRNSNTEYLKNFFHGDSSKEAFKKNVPIVEYEYIKSYVERIANGESSYHILSMEPIVEFLQSSGTSGGKRKLLPSTIEYLNKKMFAHSLVLITLMKCIGGLGEVKKMFLQFHKPETKTPSGLMTRIYTTSLAKHIQQVNGLNEVTFCSDNKQSMYSQLLCGLVERDNIVIIGSSFAPSVLNAIGFLDVHWEEMCSNIRTGLISEWVTDSDCRHSISRILNNPYPDLANSIEQICSGKSWQGILRKLWPKAKGIATIVTGAMAQYVSSLEYYGGGLPLLSTFYSSSECFVGLNLDPLCHPSDVSYTILPNMAYFEFLPVNSDHESDFATKENIVGLTDVKVGQTYEVVVTTNTGLYRYRVGDIIKVTGYYNNAPKVQFSRRKGVLLSIGSDKTTEEDLSKAVKQSMLSLEQYGFLLVDYTSYCDISLRPGHYVLFWELKKNERNYDLGLLDSKMMEHSCSIMEESLDATYRLNRGKNEIAPLEIKVVKRGTFDALMEIFISKGSSLSQYKTPRCMKSEGAIELLNSHVVGSFFSPKSPPKQ